jgi:pimeloyl-ACP methyl ester carboxylesterase
VSTWILLRGLSRESRHWGEFPAHLRAEVGDAVILAPDLPGNGRLYALDSPTRVEQMAEWCHGELPARGARPPYFLLAMSLGAMVAVAWAHRHAEEISGGVLINTSLRPISPFHQRLRPPNYPVLLHRALVGGSPAEWESTILSLTSNRAAEHAATLATWVAMRSEFPVARRNALRQLWAASRFRAESRPAVPLLVLASAADRLVDPRCSRELARRWQTDFAEHPDAGHDIPLDDGPWVAQQVGEWLRRQSGLPLQLG